MLQSGSELLHYRIVARIGAGGMGEVYRAEDMKLGRTVAIKVLPAKLAADPQWKDHLLTEARAAASLSHAAIVSIYEVGEAFAKPPSPPPPAAGGREPDTHPMPVIPAKVYFIAMEFVDGTSLSRLIGGGSGGSLPVATVAGYSVQIVEALAAAHGKGVVHRDIKSDNIMITHEGGVKVMDFGLAKTTEIADPPARATHSSLNPPDGEIAGTIDYMSPEQALGNPVDHRSDLFSFGVVLYEMLAGRRPWAGSSPVQALNRIINEAPAPVSRFNYNVPAELERILTKCLAKDRERRYASSRDLLVDLRALKQDLDSAAGPASRGQPASPAMARFAATISGSPHESMTHVSRSESGLPAASSTLSPLSTPGIRSLAILPFRSLKPDPETDFLGFSLADTIITKLDYVQSLIVRPSSYVERYVGQTVDPTAIGYELAVNTILTGNYLALGKQLRINAQLIDLGTHQILWKDVIEAPLDDLFTVQDRIATEIIDGMKLQLSPAERERLRRDVPANPQAYELFLRSKALASKMDDSRAALELLDQAIALDPEYAPAWVERGMRYNEMNVFGIGGRHFVDLSIEGAKKALELNDEFPAAYALLANMNIDLGEVETGIAQIDRAMTLRPHSPELHGMLSYGLRFAGCLKESIGAYRRAEQLEGKAGERPRSIYNNALLYSGRYQEFLAHLGTLETPVLAFYRGFAEHHLGKPEAARPHLESAIALDPEGQFGMLASAYLALLAGERVQALARVTRVTERRERSDAPDGEMDYKVAQLFAQLGEASVAVAGIEHAAGQGFFCHPYIANDPLLASVQKEPRLASILSAIRDRHEAFAEQYGDLVARRLK